MDWSLLQTWLDLPAGSWPPNHYVLLGLHAGFQDPELLEKHVLERMDRLRQHQLRHPEIVTVGMNQLAQALNCLSDQQERAAYDVLLELETSSRPLEKSLPSSEPLEAPLVQGVTSKPTRSLRWIARRRAVLRRCLRVWETLGFVLSSPEERLDRPAISYHFLVVTGEVRPLLAELRGIFEDQHVEVNLLLRTLAERDVVKELRRLPPEARNTLTVQWIVGRTALEHERQQLQLRSSPKARRGLAGFTRPLLRRLDQTPELILLLLVGFALALAGIRSSWSR